MTSSRGGTARPPVPPVALLAPTARGAAGAAEELARTRSIRFLPYSLSGFLQSRRRVSGVVLFAGEGSLRESLDFLRRIRDRLLWPPPSWDLLAAISGLISREMAEHLEGSSSAKASEDKSRKAASESGEAFASALLLEGEVTARRVRALLASPGPQVWIVECGRRVRLSDQELLGLRSRGIRWRTLDPLVVLALAAPPALARARDRWKRLLPPRTPVWILPGRRLVARNPRVTPSRRSSPRRRG